MTQGKDGAKIQTQIQVQTQIEIGYFNTYQMPVGESTAEYDPPRSFSSNPKNILWIGLTKHTVEKTQTNSTTLHPPHFPPLLKIYYETTWRPIVKFCAETIFSWVKDRVDDMMSNLVIVIIRLSINSLWKIIFLWIMTIWDPKIKTKIENKKLIIDQL